METPRTLVPEPSSSDAFTAETPRRRIARRPAPAAGEAEATVRTPARRAAAAELVLGRYRLLERLGSGGFGVVWRARDEMLGREVALKRIPLGPDGDRERATREAQASARLSHPAIVALYEACVVDGAFYLISELVEGDTLARLIASGELEDEEVLEIGLALAGALAHAHARGVIHRDIKPQNVLIPDRVPRGGEAAKLTDFGGASLVGEDALTRTGDVLGTLAYMAPEQSEGQPAGAQADLYALALVLVEALSGANPVRGATPAATARRIGRPLDSLACTRGELPPDLIDALDEALSPAPEERGSLEQLRETLEQTLEEGLATRRRRRVLRPPSARLADTREAPSPARSRGQAPRLRSPQPPRAEAPAAPPAGAEDPLALHDPLPRAEAAQRLALPRAVWIACVGAAIVWQVWIGHPGVGLLALVALTPLLIMPGEPRSSRVGAGWLLSGLAPVLGLAGLAGAFPALAGQGARWRERAVYGALGYWWLVLAEPLLDRRLWLGVPAGTPARAVWESSISATGAHVIAPALSLGVLLGALLWGFAAAVLPLLVRGRSAALDLIAAVVWSVGLAVATPALLDGLSARLTHPAPRGLVLATILGGVIVVAARALRGPV